jgi:hypothetical protein
MSVFVAIYQVKKIEHLNGEIKVTFTKNPFVFGAQRDAG